MPLKARKFDRLKKNRFRLLLLLILEFSHFPQYFFPIFFEIIRQDRIIISNLPPFSCFSNKNPFSFSSWAPPSMSWDSTSDRPNRAGQVTKQTSTSRSNNSRSGGRSFDGEGNWQVNLNFALFNVVAKAIKTTNRRRRHMDMLRMRYANEKERGGLSLTCEGLHRGGRRWDIRAARGVAGLRRPSPCTLRWTRGERGDRAPSRTRRSEKLGQTATHLLFWYFFVFIKFKKYSEKPNVNNQMKWRDHQTNKQTNKNAEEEPEKKQTNRITNSSNRNNADTQ